MSLEADGEHSFLEESALDAGSFPPTEDSKAPAVAAITATVAMGSPAGRFC